MFTHLYSRALGCCGVGVSVSVGWIVLYVKWLSALVTSSWIHARCKPRHITKSSCAKTGEHTYDKSHWAWIQQEYPGKFDFWDTYERLRAFKWGLQKIGALEDFTELLGQKCDFTQMVPSRPTALSSLDSSDSALFWPSLNFARYQP